METAASSDVIGPKDIQWLKYYLRSPLFLKRFQTMPTDEQILEMLRMSNSRFSNNINSNGNNFGGSNGIKAEAKTDDNDSEVDNINNNSNSISVDTEDQILTTYY